MPTDEYIGNELELFAHATNWKRYWAEILAPYLGKQVLDVGAGIGGTAAVLGAVAFDRYVALEPDRSNVERMMVSAKDGAYCRNFETVTGTLRDLPHASRFDTILYIDVLEHIERDSEEIERAAAHLLDGGRLLVLSPAHQWLYSPFDSAVGHVRRYDRASLLAVKPEALIAERICYLDSVGLLASSGNRLLLRASHPTFSQIKLWDGVMVRASRHVDKLLGFRYGKSIFASFRKRGEDE